MSLLTLNSTPAERMRYNVFNERFESRDHVVQNGGTIKGTPAINFGATLNGTTDYISYALQGNEFNSANISIVIEFYPDFDTDENVARMLFDSTASNRYLCYKETNANNNVLYILLGSTIIASIAEATYSPYWLVGQRNVLQISGTTGNTNAWLNGNQILTAAATAWTAKNPVTFYVGSENNTFNRFDGKIGSIKVFKSLLDANDAQALYDNSLYTYRNRAVLDLPMGMAQHDPTNLRTLDVSRSAAHATFGNGSTPTTYPTKSATRGYSFDGGDYLKVTASLFNTAGIGIGMLLKPSFAYDANSVVYMFGSSAESIYALIKQNNASSNVLTLYLGNTKIEDIASAAWGPYWNPYRWNTLIISGTTGNTSLWINGNIVLNKDTTAWTNGDPAYTIFGASYAPGNYYTGSIARHLILPFALSSIQVADLHLQMMQGVNHV